MPAPALDLGRPVRTARSSRRRPPSRCRSRRAPAGARRGARRRCRPPSGQKPGVREHLAELADLAPEHRQRPVLDVEVVVLDVREHEPREPELLVERRPQSRRRRSSARYSAVMRSRSAAIAAVGRSMSSPACTRRDVVAQEAERDLEMVEPDPVVAVEAVAGGEVEPRILRRLPGGQPLVARGRGADGGERRRRRRRSRARPATSSSTASFASLAQLVVRAEQVDLDALHHLRDRRGPRSRGRPPCRTRRSRGRPRSRG